MNLNRRQFIILTAGVAAGCKMDGGSASPSQAAARVVDAGALTDFAADGVYENFQSQGFFIIRSGEKLSAISAICTHRACKLNAAPDHSFFCKCHGSTFSPLGAVTKGPAQRDLPVLVTQTINGRLQVQVPAT